MSENLFFDNRAYQEGGGVRFCYFRGPAPRPRVERNVIKGNTAIDGAGIHCDDVDSLTITECTIVGNEAITYGGGVMIEATAAPGLRLESCTLAGNSAGAGGSGMVLAEASTADVDNTIIAFGLGAEAVYCWEAASVASFSCSDIYGNQGGDWTGCIAGQLGINGNFAEDPLFCAPHLDDFTLAESSPCAPENSPGTCGLIGAWPVGCAVTWVSSGESPAHHARLAVIPNPVRYGATFNFDVGIESPALEIYDPTGRLIDLLRPTGQSATWLPGSDAPSGVYFGRLRGAGGVRVVRFLVVR